MADEIDGDASGPTTGRGSGHSGRVQVIARMSSRRSWSTDEKLAILEEAFCAGGSVSRTADHHAIGTGQIYTWRRLALDGSRARQGQPRRRLLGSRLPTPRHRDRRWRGESLNDARWLCRRRSQRRL